MHIQSLRNKHQIGTCPNRRAPKVRDRHGDCLGFGHGLAYRGLSGLPRQGSGASAQTGAFLPDMSSWQTTAQAGPTI